MKLLGYNIKIILFDWMVTILNIFFFAGLFFDFWSHVHTKITDINTFFTPTHYFFYAAFGLICIFFTLVFFTNYKAYSFLKILPQGYNLSLLGILIFGIGGVLDFIWHYFFGFEKSIEAVVSPTHLLLAIGTILIITGPLRSVFSRSNIAGAYFQNIPALISVIMSIVIFQALTYYANHLIILRPTEPLFVKSAFTAQALGITSILLQSAIYLGFLLTLVKNNRLLPGYTLLILGITTTLTLFFSTNALKINTSIAISILTAGLFCELLLLFKNKIGRDYFWYIFFAAVPIFANCAYFIALALTAKITWSVPVYTGAILQSSIMGFILSYLSLKTPNKN